MEDEGGKDRAEIGDPADQTNRAVRLDAAWTWFKAALPLPQSIPSLLLSSPLGRVHFR